MNINLQNYEEYFIRYIEHDLSVDEMVEVNRFLKVNPELKQDLEAFRMTVLVPDKSMVFKNKELLFRASPGKLLVYWKQVTASVVAACVAVVLIVVFGKNEMNVFFGNQPATTVAQLNHEQNSNGDLSVAFPHYKNSFSTRFFNETSAPAESVNSEIKNKTPEPARENHDADGQNLNAEITAQLNKAAGQPEQLFSDEHNDPEAANFSRSNILMEPQTTHNMSVLTSYGDNGGEQRIPPSDNSSQQLQQLANKINQQINQIGTASTKQTDKTAQNNQAHPVHVSIQTKNIKFNHTFNAKSNNLIGNELLKIIQTENNKQHK